MAVDNDSVLQSKSSLFDTIETGASWFEKVKVFQSTIWLEINGKTSGKKW